MNKSAYDHLIRLIDVDDVVSNLGTSCPTVGSPNSVADAWASFGGKWISSESVDEEIASILEARSFGREEVDLG